ncbi:uncharacterized protein LOC126739457 isoform X1 [Anthonomus grandis grandis]|uniref:uncharacterized protein LOC126739457 isoform X1 n=1 Tax=Anthonomus grandis grandis TaxID=2921223 RepID=UPI0021661733|nr:uncharacterized protein LOC126739457 isoform X1 [Anthonomus grandis grandis]
MYKINQTTLFGIDEKLLGMEMERNIRDLAKVHSSQPNKSTSDQNPNQGIATLIVMIVVLTIIILFCCFSAPGIRGLCQKYIFRSCRYDDPSADNASTAIPSDSSTPTIILLPYGRMLVVDRNVFSQLQTDASGIDLMELSANLIRRQHLNNPRQLTGSTPSILDSDNTSKGLSPTSLGFGPPLYEDIFCDLPPSYSEVSLMLKNQRNGECLEMTDVVGVRTSEGEVRIDVCEEGIVEEEDSSL